MRKAFLAIITFGFLFSNAFGQKPTPTPAAQPFLTVIEDVFYIAGSGMIANGKVKRGAVKTGDAVPLE